MRNVCIVSKAKSKGARDLSNALVAAAQSSRSTIKVVRSEAPRAGYLNVGWGTGGGDLNARLPSNKLWELEKCKAAGVKTVPFQTQYPQEAGWFGRSLNHTRGLDIVRSVPIGAGLAAHRKDFWTKVIDKKREYRVHVFNGLAVRSGTKVKENGEFMDRQPIWNMDHGFQIRYEHPAPVGAKTLAKAAVAACGLDFAAVDVLESTDGKFYFLELNTRPGMTGQTIEKYASKILEMAQGG